MSVIRQQIPLFLRFLLLYIPVKKHRLDFILMIHFTGVLWCRKYLESKSSHTWKNKRCLCTSWRTADAWSSPGGCYWAASRWAEPPSSYSTVHLEAESESAPAEPAAAGRKQRVCLLHIWIRSTGRETHTHHGWSMWKLLCTWTPLMKFLTEKSW